MDIKKIARIGWCVYDDGTPPEQSLASFKEAYKHRFRILLCDVRTTLDGHYVCLHDDTINSVARNSNGSKLSASIAINDITLAKADIYDFGIYKGIQYKDTKILRLEEFLAFCESLDVTPHLEFKETFSDKQRDEIVSLIKRYGFENKVMFNGPSDDMRYIANKLPNAIMGKWVGNITDALIDDIATYGKNNKKFIYVSNGFEYSITEENYKKCLEKGIDIGYTEIRSTEELANVKNLGFLKYCKYVATKMFDIS